ncbi:MAG TPA: hypothetical protein PKG92_09760, partial [Anaerolineaceae bacterium]|nr:hypothetical protein [Anaerolineaceae bacterium]
ARRKAWRDGTLDGGQARKTRLPMHTLLVPENRTMMDYPFPWIPRCFTANLCAYPSKHFGLKDRKKVGSA